MAYWTWSRFLYYWRSWRLVEWKETQIAEFLRDREQKVVVDNEMSKWTKVLSGVLQDSILGPVWFLIYINNLSGQVEIVCRWHQTIQSYRKTREILILQNDLCKLCEWCKIWQLRFNTDKYILKKWKGRWELFKDIRGRIDDTSPG